MLFHATPARRKLVVAILLVFALVGGAIRIAAPNPSMLRDFGSLMLNVHCPFQYFVQSSFYLFAVFQIFFKNVNGYIFAGLNMTSYYRKLHLFL